MDFSKPKGSVTRKETIQTVLITLRGLGEDTPLGFTCASYTL